MSINIDNTKITFDFEYVDNNVQYSIKFHNTPELGETISLSEDGTNYFSYPAAMFVEVGTFLKDQKLVKSLETKQQKPENKHAKHAKHAKEVKIGEMISQQKQTDRRAVSGFGGLSLPVVEGEGESDILVSDETEEIVVEKKTSLAPPIIQEFSTDTVEQEKVISEEEVKTKWQQRQEQQDSSSKKIKKLS